MFKSEKTRWDETIASATVGFVGLGTMGREMALNLLKAGLCSLRL